MMRELEEDDDDDAPEVGCLYLRRSICCYILPADKKAVDEYTSNGKSPHWCILV